MTKQTEDRFAADNAMRQAACEGPSDDGGCGIYGYAARTALVKWHAFAKASPSDTLAALSAAPLNDNARNAIRASAEKLGYGRDGCSWLCLKAANDGSELPTEGLKELVESLDPVSVIAADAHAASALSNAYGIALKANDVARMNGRTVVCLDGFEQMLGSEEGKQLAWRLMKHLHL